MDKFSISRTEWDETFLQNFHSRPISSLKRMARGPEYLLMMWGKKPPTQMMTMCLTWARAWRALQNYRSLMWMTLIISPIGLRRRLTVSIGNSIMIFLTSSNLRSAQKRRLPKKANNSKDYFQISYEFVVSIYLLNII